MAVSDWDRRELCPDDTCVGLIGPDGTCKICGRAAPNWGDERRRGTQDDPDGDEGEDEDEDNAPADPIQPAARVAIGGGEWSARTLCRDGACVGVIGADGTCKVCGKAGVAAPADELEDDEEYEDDEYEDEEEDDELAAAADELAGVASSTEVESAKELAQVGGDEEENRKLCPDGACIGVIGPDGKCKICRKEAA